MPPWVSQTAPRRYVRRLRWRGTWQRPLALYGFTSFTAAQREVVVALSQRVEVLVTFTYDHSREANLTTPAEIAWWTARAATTETVAPPRRAYTSASIEYLERQLHEQRGAPAGTAGRNGPWYPRGVRFLLAFRDSGPSRIGGGEDRRSAPWWF